MSLLSYSLLFLSLLSQVAPLAIDVHKFLLQRDMSEYCRRHVIPSVFLSRDTMDATAEMLQYSQLELPYSCYTSVRAETGSNIILVIQVVSPEGLKEACRTGNQLLVYEMGETFGGYWGAMPDAVLQEQSTYSQYYTLAQRRSRRPWVTETADTEETTEQMTTVTKSWFVPSEHDTIKVDIPLVNVSLRLEHDGRVAPGPVDISEAFDVIYDVIPRKGEKYDTNIMPLAQISVGTKTKASAHRQGEEPKYQMDIGSNFDDIDPRISYPYLFDDDNDSKGTVKYDSFANKRLDFKKERLNKLFSAKKNINSDVYMKEILTLRNYLLGDVPGHGESSPAVTVSNESEVFFEDIMKVLRQPDGSSAVASTTEADQLYSLLHQISSANYNYSEYMTTNLFKTLTTLKSIGTTNYDFKSLIRTTSSPLSFSTPDTSSGVPSTQSDDRLTHDVTLSSATSDNMKDYVTSEMSSQTEKLPRFTTENVYTMFQTPFKYRARYPLVDHKSWENLVQVAPVIADVLDIPLKKPANTTSTKNEITNDAPVRSKRYIKAIRLVDWRPHRANTPRVTAETPRDASAIELQEYIQFAELQDDELQSRVALRYLKHYVGPVLFNLCQNDTKPQNVLLLNTSRVVLAISNFTMPRMTLVMTAAATVVGSDNRCPRESIECQVLGTRVCVASTVACDGVPNCGANEIYDEDKMLCGSDDNLMKSVYLAAGTFLALVLVGLYTLHHWLRRCVPRVSDAFFVYKNGSENVLYLNSIMRSPTYEDRPDITIRDNLLDDLSNDNKTVKKVFITRFIQKFCSCCFKKKLKQSVSLFPLASANSPRVYSFTQLELSKIGKLTAETAVQTGDSLEMPNLGSFWKQRRISPSSSKSLSYELNLSPSQSRNKYELRISKNDVSLTLPGPSRKRKESIKAKIINEDPIDEMELYNTAYDLRKYSSPSTSTHVLSSRTSEVREKRYSEKPEEKFEKRLRFEQEPVNIADQVIEERPSMNPHRRSTFVGYLMTPWRSDSDAPPVTVVEQRETSAPKRFWSNVKTTRKKPKKKIHNVTLK